MEFTFKLEALPGGRKARVVVTGDVKYFQDVSVDMMYEAITEITNNAVRKLVAELAPRMALMRKGIQ